MTARETTLNGESILSIEAATPSGADLELRSARRGQINVSLSRSNQVEVFVSNVHASKVMVGRLSDVVHCLFVGPASIDITPAASADVDAWLGRLAQAISA
jgi:hypothetical protein